MPERTAGLEPPLHRDRALARLVRPPANYFRNFNILCAVLPTYADRPPAVHGVRGVAFSDKDLRGWPPPGRGALLRCNPADLLARGERGAFGGRTSFSEFQQRCKANARTRC
jgi:hypothetical protein